MKNRAFLLIFFAVLISGCSKEHNAESLIEKEAELEITEEDAPEAPEIQPLNITKYVDAPKGLRVRNAPDTGSERIGLLADLAEVLVIQEEENFTEIDGRYGRWTFIETSDIQGWVFSGYLSESPLRLHPFERTMALTAKNNFDDILNYIERYFDWQTMIRYAESLEDIMSAFSEDGNYSLTKETWHSDYLWGGVTIEESNIECGPYTLEVWGETRIQNFKITLGYDNFLALFPYRTMEEFLADDNFGTIYWQDEDSIQYTYGDPGAWTLHFVDNVLDSITYTAYVT